MNFLQVQAQVKKTKARFDKLKLDTMQKIDLLAASRCNMFSHVLVTYQQTLLHFWEKTSRTHSAVAESFKGYQYYEFNMLRVRKFIVAFWQCSYFSDSSSSATCHVKIRKQYQLTSALNLHVFGHACSYSCQLLPQELAEPSKELAKQTGQKEVAERDIDG